MNNSGTTIMSQYLASNLLNSYLPPFGSNEGQMAPKVKKMMRLNSWDPNSKFDWNFIKSEWDSLAIKANKNFFIEASPPNLYRLSDILSSFKDANIVFSISSPYSYISSCVYNYGCNLKARRRLHNTSDVKFIPEFDRFFEDCVSRSTEQWILNANKQRDNIESLGAKNFLVTYEDFCATPSRLLDILNLQKAYCFNKNDLIKGKNNSKITEIIDMSPKHLSFLGTKGILIINKLLSKKIDLLSYFNYKILTLDDCNSIILNDLLSSFDGYQRKFALIARHKAKTIKTKN